MINAESKLYKNVFIGSIDQASQTVRTPYVHMKLRREYM